MNYQKIHNQIIERAQDRASSKKEANSILGYSEQHRIVPKCLGGSNERSNLVHLSAREHFIIHILLTKIYPQEGKLLYACQRLLFTKHNERLNGKSYEVLKRQINNYKKSLNKHNDEGIARRASKLKGRTKEEYEYIETIAAKRRGKTKYNDKSIASMAESLTGRNKENNESVARMAETLTGRTKEEYKYIENAAKKRSLTMTGRTKEEYEYIENANYKKRGRTKENHPGVKAGAEKQKGRSKYTHEYIAQNAENRKKLSKELETLLVQMRDIEHKKLREIHEYVLGLGIQIKFPSISTIIIRRRKELTLHTEY